MMQMRTHTCNELRLGDAGKRAIIEFVGENEYRNTKATSAIPTVE